MKPADGSEVDAAMGSRPRLVSRLRRALLAVIACLATLPVLGADSSPSEHLQRMGVAMRSIAYEGVFVYSQGDRSESLRVVHDVVDGESRERVTALTGGALEIIRHGDEIACLMPDQGRAVIGHQPRGLLPGALVDGLAGALAYYRVVAGGQARVAGRDVRGIRLEPVDRYRHGFHLWIDREHDLLLRSDLVAHSGEILERVMFTALDVGEAVEQERFRYSLDEFDRVDEVMPISGDAEVAASELAVEPGVPPGFRLIAVDTAGEDSGRQHAVYSDGMTTVSLFIDADVGARLPAAGGTSALTMRSTETQGYRVTALGAVPAATLEYMLAGANGRAGD